MQDCSSKFSRVRKSFSQVSKIDAIPQPSDQDKNDLLDSNLNIDNLTPGEGLRVKVVIVNSSGNVTTRIPRDEESKQLVRQLCNKNWQAATNSIINKQAYLNPVQNIVHTLFKQLLRYFVVFITPGHAQMNIPDLID